MTTGLRAVDNPEDGPAAGMSYVGPASEIPAILAGFEADAEEIFGAADLDPRLFNCSHSQVSVLALEKLLLLCAERTNCAHFGLLVGEKTKLRALGPVGSLMKASATLGDALRGLESHIQLRTRGGIVQIELDAGVAVLRYCPYHSNGEGAGHVCEAALAAITQVLRALCGPKWAPLEVLIPRRVPASTEAYSSFFRASVRFNYDLAALVMNGWSIRFPVQTPSPAQSWSSASSSLTKVLLQMPQTTYVDNSAKSC